MTLTKTDYQKFYEHNDRYGNKLPRNIIMGLIINHKNDIDDELFKDISKNSEDLEEFLYLIPKNFESLLKKSLTKLLELKNIKSQSLDKFLGHFSDSPTLLFIFAESEAKKIERLQAGNFS